MTQEDFFDSPQVFVQFEGVSYNRMPAASIEEIIFLICLNEGRKSMFPQTNPAAYCVFTNDRYSHKSLL
jgi:hypothetical protein